MSAVMDVNKMNNLLEANEPTEEAQAARMAAVRGKRMLFVGGDFQYPNMAPFLRKHLCMLREHGCVVIAVFQEGKRENYFREAEEAGCFDSCLFADVGAEDGHLNVARAVLEAGIEVDAVWSPHEATQPIVGGVAHELGLPGNPPEAYECARDKYLTRKALDKAGLNTIRAMQIWSTEDARRAATEVGFPMIIKPTVGMGSSGVYRANNEEELNNVLERLFRDIKEDWALSRNTVGKQAPVLAETFITPSIFTSGNVRVSEFDVEIMLWDGKPVYGNVLDNWEPQAPYFQDLASNAPSITSADMQRELIDYCARAAVALGFSRGGFHMEAWLTPTGPVLIECNPRVGGGATVHTHEHVWGVNPMLEFTLAMLDIPINPPRAEQPLCSYGLVLVNAPVTGLVGEEGEELTFLELSRRSEMVIESSYMVKPGARVRGLDSGVPNWLGELHYCHKGDVGEMLEEMDRAMAVSTAAAAAQTVRPKQVPAPDSPTARPEEESC